ncbi:MAG: DNA repair protein RecO [Clostridia bacterium]|nr:DNA repair protein RecO [Clostridia bacterium]
MRFTTEALVIRESNIGEQDRLITLLTRDMGVIRAFAPGAKSIKSKKGAATGLLSYAAFTIEKKNDSYRIYEASAIRVFFGAGSDIVTLSLAQYFCELSSVLVPRDTDSEEFLRLVLNSLHFLTTEKRSPALMKAITEMRLAVLSGYSPNLVACDICGKFEDDLQYFYITDGKLVCSDCAANTVNALPVDRTLLSALRHIVYAPFKELYHFTIPDVAAEQLSRITEKYIVYQTEHHYATLDFYNTVV